MADQFQSEYYLSLRQFLKNEYRTKRIYPSMYDIFNAFHLTPYENVKVVILGQDPYHGPNQAHGLCFSVKKGVAQPPSLKNIFKELSSAYGCTIPDHGCLTDWAEQGVLLLNTVLTVVQHRPRSHRDRGWELFTDKVIQILNERTKPIVFLLWGNDARRKKHLLSNPNHLVLESAHPSPLSASRGFFGNNHFKKANLFLQNNNLKQINWCIQ